LIFYSYTVVNTIQSLYSAYLFVCLFVYIDAFDTKGWNVEREKKRWGMGEWYDTKE